MRTRRSLTVNGVPVPILLMFAGIGIFGAFGDFKMLRAGALRGGPRLARHLWRMWWALWIAAASFFLGRARASRCSCRNRCSTLPFGRFR